MHSLDRESQNRRINGNRGFCYVNIFTGVVTHNLRAVLIRPATVAPVLQSGTLPRQRHKLRVHNRSCVRLHQLCSFSAARSDNGPNGEDCGEDYGEDYGEDTWMIGGRCGEIVRLEVVIERHLVAPSREVCNRPRSPPFVMKAFVSAKSSCLVQNHHFVSRKSCLVQNHV